MAICLAVLLLSVFSCSDPLAGWLRKKQQNRALGALYYWASRESIVPLLGVFSPHFQILVRAPRGVGDARDAGPQSGSSRAEGRGWRVPAPAAALGSRDSPGVKEEGRSSDAGQGMGGLGTQVYLGHLKAGSAQTQRDPTSFPSIPRASPGLRTLLVCGPSVGSHPFQVFPLSE